MEMQREPEEAKLKVGVGLRCKVRTPVDKLPCNLAAVPLFCQGSIVSKSVKGQNNAGGCLLE